MGLFDKKTCDICGAKIGLLGNRKLDDGNMCGDCAKKLSPFLTDRRKTTLAAIKDHLAYREANKAEVAAFAMTRAVGGKTKVLIDDGAGKFIVSSSNNWKNDNPDVISLSQVTFCKGYTQENRTEIMKTDKNGKKVSHFPRQYKIEHDYTVKIGVNSPWFDEINIHLGARVDSESLEARTVSRQQDEITDALSRPDPRPAAQGAPVMPAASAGPKACPSCGAVAASWSGKFCESCGGPLGG